MIKEKILYKLFFGDQYDTYYFYYYCENLSLELSRECHSPFHLSILQK